MPIAVAPVDWQLRPVLLEFVCECGNQRSILRIQRTDAVESPVMLDHFEHPLARNVAPAQHVLEEPAVGGHAIDPQLAQRAFRSVAARV